MTDRIEVTSADLRELGGDVRSTAESIFQELTRVRSRVQELTSGMWKGQAATRFDAYYEQMNTGWGQVREGMEGVAGLLDGAAQQYEETEAGIAGQFG